MTNTGLKYMISRMVISAVFVLFFLGGPFISAYASLSNQSDGQCAMNSCCCCIIDTGFDNADDCGCQVDRQPVLPEFPEAIGYSPNYQDRTSTQADDTEAFKDLLLLSDKSIIIFNPKFININSPPLYLVNSSFLI
jgi:hypothetical protein